MNSITDLIKNAMHEMYTDPQGIGIGNSFDKLKNKFWKQDSIFNFQFAILTSIYQKTMNSITNLIKNAMNEMYTDPKLLRSTFRLKRASFESKHWS